jgi:hypothetical protein
VGIWVMLRCDAKVGGSTFYIFFHFTRAFDGPRLSTNFEAARASALQPQCDHSACL